MVAMDLLEDAAQPRAEHPIQRGLEQFEDGDLEPQLAERGRDLGPDEPHAHDDRAPRVGRRSTDCVGVGDRAELVDAGQVRAGNFHPAVPNAGCHERPIEGDALPVGQCDGPFPWVDRPRSHPQAGLDVVGFPPPGRPHQKLVAGLGAAQIRLGQAGPLVGQARFVADQDDAPVETVLTKGRGRRTTGKRGAHHHEGPGARH